MAEEDTTEQEERQPLQRFRVRLDGNRGETVMKLTADQADAMGDRILGEHDSEQRQFTAEQDNTKFADQTATPADADDEEEDDPEEEKARTASNKSRSARNK